MSPMRSREMSHLIRRAAQGAVIVSELDDLTKVQVVNKIKQTMRRIKRIKKVIKNLIRNFNLMWLNSEMIPEYVTQEMEKEIIRGTEMPKRNITIDRIKILEGTEWISVDQTPKQFDPFSLFNS